MNNNASTFEFKKIITAISSAYVPEAVQELPNPVFMAARPKITLEPQQIELIKPSIDSFLKTLNKGNDQKNSADLRGLFNILLNLVKGQIAKSKAKITLKMEDLTLHAFKYMLDNNLLKCEALRFGFE